jgi:prevent-host-death family protein
MDMEGVKKISTSEARQNFSELVSKVAYGRERVILHRRENPLAALISVEELRLFEMLLEDYENRMDTEAALSALSDEDDEEIPWKDAREDIGL